MTHPVLHKKDRIQFCKPVWHLVSLALDILLFLNNRSSFLVSWTREVPEFTAILPWRSITYTYKYEQLFYTCRKSLCSTTGKYSYSFASLLSAEYCALGHSITARSRRFLTRKYCIVVASSRWNCHSGLNRSSSATSRSTSDRFPKVS